MELFHGFDTRLERYWSTALAADPLSSMPFLTYSWHSRWYARFGADERLCVLVDPDANILIPLSISKNTVHFTGGEEIADYLDEIGAPEKKADAWRQALPPLTQQGASMLLLRNIPEHSPTLTFFRSVAAATVTEEDTTPILSLPDSFDAYLAALDRKDRHELRRKMKKFEAERPTLHFSVRQTDTIDMDALLQLMHHDADKTAFLTPEMTQFFSQLPAMAPESIRQFMLTVEEKIIASTLAFQSSDSLLLYNSGFDPQYPGAGWYIKVKTIAWAIEHHFTSYNFLQGNERYKYDLGAKDAPVYRVSMPLG